MGTFMHKVIAQIDKWSIGFYSSQKSDGIRIKLLVYYEVEVNKYVNLCLDIYQKKYRLELNDLDNVENLLCKIDLPLREEIPPQFENLKKLHKCFRSLNGDCINKSILDSFAFEFIRTVKKFGVKIVNVEKIYNIIKQTLKDDRAEILLNIFNEGEQLPL